MDDSIKTVFKKIKSRVENISPFVVSEIKLIEQPSLRGETALYYTFETETNGISIFFYDNGFFEIMTDLIVNENNENYYYSHVPPNYQTQKYSTYDIEIFVQKTNELLDLINDARK
jgi:hypothetical protein